MGFKNLFVDRWPAWWLQLRLILRNVGNVVVVVLVVVNDVVLVVAVSPFFGPVEDDAALLDFGFGFGAAVRDRRHQQVLELSIEWELTAILLRSSFFLRRESRSHCLQLQPARSERSCRRHSCFMTSLHTSCCSEGGRVGINLHPRRSRLILARA